MKLSQPVFLYIKEHNITGLKYFGRTVKDPQHYQGSGLMWCNHIKKYGYDVTTKVIGTYYDEETLQRDALNFSVENDIVASKEWANLVPETGLVGVPAGSRLRRDPIIEAARLVRLESYWSNPEWRKMMTDKHKKAWSEERKTAHSQKMMDNWTEDRKRSHSSKIKEKWSEGTTYEATLEALSAPKSQEHKENIARALAGKPKSPQHIQNLKASIQNRRPPTAPKEAIFVEDGVYLYRDKKITRVKRKVWKVEGMEKSFDALRKAIVAINNQYLLKEK